MSENILFRELAPESTLHNGQYVIKKVIGMGGFGITYYARHTTLHQNYAIKEFFINGSCTRNTQTKKVHLQGITREEYDHYKQKFIEEAQKLAELEHPNIVEVINFFEENDTAYMVMKLIKGVTLQHLVESQEKLDYEVAVNYIAQISEAVGYIHKLSILHRDIKPDNIIITSDHRAILIDFGSARKFIHDKMQSHTIMLTKGYAPLEQYSSTSINGMYSDIYSLGAVFYFALTGQKPMDATDRSLVDSMPEPRSLVDTITDDANRTIMKAMSLSAENRHQSIQEFMADLLGEKPSVRATPVIDKAKIRNKKSRIRYLSAAMLSFAAIFLLGYGLWHRHVNDKNITADHKLYTELIALAETNRQKGEDYYAKTLELYQQAADYEDRYIGTKAAERFTLNAQDRKKEIERTIDSLFTAYSSLALDALENWNEFQDEDEKKIGQSFGKKALKLKQDHDFLNKLKAQDW